MEALVAAAFEQHVLTIILAMASHSCLPTATFAPANCLLSRRGAALAGSP
jgi:hypothetical protein